MPSARRRPSFTISATTVMLSMNVSTRLPSRSVAACGEPRYGTCWILMPAVGEQLQRQMLAGAVARRGAQKLARVRLRHGDELAEVLRRMIGISDEHEGKVRQHADPGKILQCVVRQLVVDRRRHRVTAGGEEQRRAVGRGARDLRR